MNKVSNNAHKWFGDECKWTFFCGGKTNSRQDPSEPSPPHVLTNQRCPCPLGSAAGNDFRCTADPSTFLPFKAFTNSPSLCTRRAKQGSQWSWFMRTAVRAERGSQSMQITGKPQRTIEEVHAKLLAMLEDPRNHMARSLEVSSNVSSVRCSRSISAAKNRPLEKIKELIMLLRQVHSVAEPSWHN